MPPDDQPPYDGPFVVIAPEGLTYTVKIEPSPLPSGDGEPRTYGSKHEAFGAAQALWSAHKLPCRDLTDGHVSQHYEK